MAQFPPYFIFRIKCLTILAIAKAKNTPIIVAISGKNALTAPVTKVVYSPNKLPLIVNIF